MVLSLIEIGYFMESLFHFKTLQYIATFFSVLGGVYAAYIVLVTLLGSRTNIKIFVNRMTFSPNNGKLIWSRLDFLNKSKQPLSVFSMQTYDIAEYDSYVMMFMHSKLDKFKVNSVLTEEFIRKDIKSATIDDKFTYEKDIVTTDFPINLNPKSAKGVLIEFTGVENFTHILLITSRGKKLIKVDQRYKKQVPQLQIR